MRSAAPAPGAPISRPGCAAFAFVTSWYKGFREQNILKRLYNSVMARGDRVIATSEQLAQLVNDRYGTPWDKIAVVPCSIDFDYFDPASCDAERIAAMRTHLGRQSRHQGHPDRRPHPAPQRPSCRGARGAAFARHGLQGFSVCLCRRRPWPHPLYRRALGPGAGHRHHGRDPHGRTRARHAGGLCRRLGRGLGGDAAGGRAALDPGSPGDGAAADRVRSRPPEPTSS